MNNSNLQLLKEKYSNTVDNTYKELFKSQNNAGQQIENQQEANTGVSAAESYIFNNNISEPVSTNGGLTDFTKTSNGIVGSQPLLDDNSLAKGYLFDTAENQDQAKYEMMKSQYIDSLKKQLAELTKPGRQVSRADNIMIDQIQYELANPDQASIFAFNGYNPEELEPKLKQTDNPHLQQFNNTIKELQQVNKSTTHSANSGSLLSKGNQNYDIVYILRNDKDKKIKVGYTSGDVNNRYISQDPESLGFTNKMIYKVPKGEGRYYEDLLHKSLRSAGTHIFEPGFGSGGKTEIYGYDPFEKQNNTKVQQLWDNATNQQINDEHKKIALQIQNYSGYWSNTLKAIGSGTLNLVGSVGYGISNTVRKTLNDYFEPEDNQIRKGVVTKFFQTLRDNSDELAGYSTKDEEEMSKNYDLGIEAIQRGNYLQGLAYLAHTLKGVLPVIAKSAPTMVAYAAGGEGILTAKSIAALTPLVLGQYQQEIDNYKKHNNGIEPTSNIKADILAAAFADQAMQKGALEYIIPKATNVPKRIFMKVKGKDGNIITDLDHLVATKQANYKPLLHNFIVKAMSKGVINFGKGALAEAPAEAIDQLVQYISERYNTDDYKKESLLDFIKNDAYEALKNAFIGGITGGTMKSVLSTPVDFAKSYVENQQQQVEHFNQKALSTLQYLPEKSNNPEELTKQKIIEQLEPRKQQLQQQYKQLKQLHNNINANNIKDISNNYKELLNNETINNKIDSLITEINKVKNATGEPEIQLKDNMSVSDKINTLLDNIKDNTQQSHYIKNEIKNIIKNTVQDNLINIENHYKKLKLIDIATNSEPGNKQHSNIISTLHNKLFGKEFNPINNENTITGSNIEDMNVLNVKEEPKAESRIDILNKALSDSYKDMKESDIEHINNILDAMNVSKDKKQIINKYLKAIVKSKLNIVKEKNLNKVKKILSNIEDKGKKYTFKGEQKASTEEHINNKINEYTKQLKSIKKDKTLSKKKKKILTKYVNKQLNLYLNARDLLTHRNNILEQTLNLKQQNNNINKKTSNVVEKVSNNETTNNNIEEPVVDNINKETNINNKEPVVHINKQEQYINKFDSEEIVKDIYEENNIASEFISNNFNNILFNVINIKNDTTNLMSETFLTIMKNNNLSKINNRTIIRFLVTAINNELNTNLEPTDVLDIIQTIPKIEEFFNQITTIKNEQDIKNVYNEFKELLQQTILNCK